MIRQWDKGFPEVERALTLEPDSPDVLLNAANFLMYVGKHEEAIEMAKRGIERAPGNMISYINLTSALSKAGRYEEARAAATEVLKINPKFSLEQYARRLPYKDQSYTDRTIDALHKAGLK
jgi:tetratricopeptide (TPR) repeat protein